jgi:1,4-alpha-glucan branching enzyme
MAQRKNSSDTMTIPTPRQSKSRTKAEASDRRIEIELSCDAPQAETVFVAGDFNHWRAADTRLRRDKTGVWKVQLWLEPGRYEYRFSVDAEWQDDPHAAVRVPNEFGSTNSVLEVE